MKIYLSEHIDNKAMHKLVGKYEIVDNLNNPDEIVGAIVRVFPLDKATLDKMPNLKIISKHGVGTDNIDVAEATRRGITVKNVTGVAANSVAELAVGYMISLSRRLKEINIGLGEGRYETSSPSKAIGTEVHGKKIGFVGCGDIASKIATIMKNGFSCQVYCFNPGKNSEECKQLGFVKIDSLEELFATMDYVSINVPLNAKTANMINWNIFEKANKNLILVNTSRGGIVNENDLYEALINGKIKGAASDVFAEEPVAKDNPLLKLENFIATVHIGINTSESLERVGLQAVENIIEYFEK